MCVFSEVSDICVYKCYSDILCYWYKWPRLMEMRSILWWRLKYGIRQYIQKPIFIHWLSVTLMISLFIYSFYLCYSFSVMPLTVVINQSIISNQYSLYLLKYYNLLMCESLRTAWLAAADLATEKKQLISAGLARKSGWKNSWPASAAQLRYAMAFWLLAALQRGAAVATMARRKLIQPCWKLKWLKATSVICGAAK